MTILIRMPKEVANTKFGKTRLVTLLTQMGAEVVGSEVGTSQKYEEDTDDVSEVMQYHEKLLGKYFPRGLDYKSEERRKIVRARLRKFRKEDLFKVIDRVANSPFHLGKNDAGKKYLDFKNIMSNDTKVEHHLNALLDEKPTLDNNHTLRLTVVTIGAKIRSGEATLEEKQRFQDWVKELHSSTGEAYDWRTDTFTM